MKSASFKYMCQVKTALAKRFIIFSWKMRTQKEIRESGLFDPPCHLIEGTFGCMKILLCSDGEIYVQPYGSDPTAVDVVSFCKDLPSVDLCESPEVIANCVFDLVRAMNDNPSIKQ